MRLLILCFFVSFITSTVFANTYSKNDTNTVQFTPTNKDSSLTVSHDNTMIAFVRIGTHKIPKGCDDFANTDTPYGNQIWIYNTVEKKNSY